MSERPRLVVVEGGADPGAARATPVVGVIDVGARERDPGKASASVPTRLALHPAPDARDGATPGSTAARERAAAGPPPGAGQARPGSGTSQAPPGSGASQARPGSGASQGAGLGRTSGPLPLELAQELPRGHAVVWWARKQRMDVGAIAIVAGAAAGLLAAASVVVPGLWRLPWAELLPPLAVLFAPAALVAVREWASLRAVVVTDRGVIDVPLRGAVDVLHFSGIRRVRRDWLRGGVRLEGAAHQVVIPAALADDARAAIREQRASSMAHLAGAVDDPLQWL